MPVQENIINRDLQQLVLQTFQDEVNALKPGNVSRYSDGHGMTTADFYRSAELVTPILCDASLDFGQRILRSVETTMEQIGCNTNLGMLLLFTPVIMVIEKNGKHDAGQLAISIDNLVTNIPVAQSQDVYKAIKLAAPGGLGHTDKFDVELLPECNLYIAMQHAQQRDFIAKQYVTGFKEIINIGADVIKQFTRRWNSVEWAVVACYLTFLGKFEDTHIERKYSRQVASGIKQQASQLARLFKNKNNPEDAKTALLDFDTELKKKFINPGTSADLTAASLLIYKLMN